MTAIVLAVSFIKYKKNYSEQRFSTLKEQHLNVLKLKIQDRLDNLEVVLNNSFNNRTQALNFLDTLQFPDGYIFVIDVNKTMLIHKNRMITNIPFDLLEDKKLKENITLVVNAALKEHSTFIEYRQSDNLFKDFEQSKKISYLKYIPKFEFIIGTGIYTNDLNKEVSNIKLNLGLSLQSEINRIMLGSFIITFIILVIYILLVGRIKKSLD